MIKLILNFKLQSILTNFQEEQRVKVQLCQNKKKNFLKNFLKKISKKNITKDMIKQ